MYLLIPGKKMKVPESMRLLSMKLTVRYDSSRLNVTGWKKNIDNLAECDHKKKLSFIDSNHLFLSITRQIELLSISRSSYYYVPIIDPEQNILLAKLDNIYTAHPFLGSRKLSKLLKIEGYSVGRYKVASLMKILGIQVLYPHKKNINTTVSNPEHKKYPYLLRWLTITHANQVWSTDITYIRMNHGFIYLVAIIDWYSRKVLSWKISTSMDVSFCTQALQEAIYQYGTPEIFNTDQWSQFTSTIFTNMLDANNIRISMDGRWRWADNIFVERLWRTIKQEEVYIKSYNSPIEAILSIQQYLIFYNSKRPHQSLNYQTPTDIYEQSISLQKS